MYALGWVVGPNGSLSHTGETPNFTSGIRIDGNWGVVVLRNIAANQREQRLDEITPGILDILRGQKPIQNVTDLSFRKTMVELMVLFVLLLGGLAWSLSRLRKWRLQLNYSKKSIRAYLGILILLFINLAISFFLWYMGPISNHRSFSVLALSAPDEMLLLASNIVVALISAAVQIVSFAQLQGVRNQARINNQN
jgi:hypothetical protein